MGFGILDDNKLPHIPGTVLLDQEAAQSEGYTQRLKHGTGGNVNIILVPQPSEDPNDPLNWSSFRKNLSFGILCFGAMIWAAVNGIVLVAGTVQEAIELDVTVTDIAKLSGYTLLVAGATGPVISAISCKYGKRPVFIFSSVMGLIGTILGSCSHDYNSLKTARIVSGFATSAYESIVIASIGDLYFVHQRGFRVGLVNFIWGGAANLAQVISGPVTLNLGWHYLFHMLIAFGGLQFILLLLFCPETQFVRSKIYELDTAPETDYDRLGEIEMKAAAHQDNLQPSASYNPPPPRKTFFQRMAIYTGSYSKNNVFTMLLATIAIVTNISALWVIIVTGLLVAWIIATSFAFPPLLYAPPYLFNSAQVGYVSTGPLLGSMLGLAFCGLTLDPVLKAMARGNKGVYEPEFRIPYMAFAAVTIVAGLVGFGQAVAAYESVYLVAFIWGIILFGVMMATISLSAYAIDSFRDNATEIFIMAIVFKNFFFYGASTFINDWVTASGPKTVFNILGGISAALCLTAIPVYVYGKRYRSFWARYNVLKMLHLDGQFET